MHRISKRRPFAFFFVPALLLLGPTSALPQTPSPQEIMNRAYRVFFYSGDDMKAKVRMRLVSKEGSERIRELTMLRKNLAGGEQRYFIYFHSPADVREMTFMVWKYPQRDDERWLFIPAVKMVRRIAANDKRSSFVGSDFSYEDISGREVEDDTHTLAREDTLNGRPVFVIRSVPKDEKSSDFAYRLASVDKENSVLWREEYYDKRNRLYKVFTADEVKQVMGQWTTLRRTMNNVQNDHRTEVVFSEVEYNVGLEDSLFSERYLSNPPARWIR
jgi:outer membrane lipoprotein-sorting protein